MLETNGLSFDPQLYHCVEPVTRGERRSIALFSPRSWKRIPAHCLDELIEVGFYPLFSAQNAESEETALLLDGSFTPLPSLAALGQAHQPSQALWPLSGQVCNLTLPDHDEQVLLPMNGVVLIMLLYLPLIYHHQMALC